MRLSDWHAQVSLTLPDPAKRDHFRSRVQLAAPTGEDLSNEALPFLRIGRPALDIAPSGPIIFLEAVSCQLLAKPI